MISAQNRLLQLSGNKQLYLFVWTFFWMATGCSSSKLATSQEVLTPIQKEKTVQTEPEKKPEVVEEKKEQATKPGKETLAEDKTPSTQDKAPKPAKEVYNLAVILPFHVEQVPLNYSHYIIDTDINLSEEATKSLDFYMGLKLAADDFQSKGKKINVFVLDDATNSETARSILKSRPFPDVDAIIGSSSPFVAKVLLDYAKEKSIPVFSPFLDDISESYGNNMLYLGAISAQSQIELLVQWANKLYPEKDILVLNDPSEDISSKILTQLEEIQKQYRNIKLNSYALSGISADDINALQLETGSPIVIIASERESYVKKALSLLSQVTQNLPVFGLQSCQTFKNTDWNSIPQHSMRIAGINITSSKLRSEFSNRFKNEFTKEENETAVLGYDMSTYILHLLETNQLSTMPSSSEIQDKLLKNNFEFSAKQNQSGRVYKNVNTGLKMLLWNKTKFILE